MDGLNVKILM